MATILKLPPANRDRRIGKERDLNILNESEICLNMTDSLIFILYLFSYAMSFLDQKAKLS